MLRSLVNAGVVFFGLFIVNAGASLAEDWQPKKAPVMTRWAKDVTPDNVHPEYPRPQMVRKDWVNLNDLWDYAIEERGGIGPLHQQLAKRRTVVDAH